LTHDTESRMRITDTGGKTASHLLLRVCAASIPTVAVLIGLYVFSNGWLTIAIYYTAVPVYIIATRQVKVFTHLTRGVNARLILLAASIFALSGPAAYLALPLAARSDTSLIDFLNAIGLGEWRYLVLAVIFCTVNPVLEETFWRGTFRTDPDKLSWTDFAFAAFHIPVVLKVATLPLAIVCLAVLVLAGRFLRYLTHKTQGLATPYLVHLTADISITVSIWYLANP